MKVAIYGQSYQNKSEISTSDYDNGSAVHENDDEENQGDTNVVTPN